MFLEENKSYMFSEKFNFFLKIQEKYLNFKKIMQIKKLLLFEKYLSIKNFKTIIDKKSIKMQ